MNRPTLSDVLKHYEEIYLWVRSYVDNDDEAQGLTNQIHYLSIKERRKALAIGVLAGWASFGILMAWIA